MFPILKGKVAIVTGSSRGIGRALALAFAEQGCDVVVTGKSVESTAGLEGSIYTVAEEVEARGARCLPFQLDVRDEARVEEMVAATARELGAPAILVNNASALWWKPIEGTPLSRFDLIHSINARGTFACTRAVLPFMREAGWGHVVTQSPPIELDKMASMSTYAGRTAGRAACLACLVASTPQPQHADCPPRLPDLLPPAGVAFFLLSARARTQRPTIFRSSA
jgi:NAD(P)-dependent dehydrogenase (short-subunit alcohol dehydrogenase family)